MFDGQIYQKKPITLVVTVVVANVVVVAAVWLVVAIACEYTLGMHLRSNSYRITSIKHTKQLKMRNR